MAKAAELVPKNAWAVRLEVIRDRAASKTFTAFVERVCRTPGEFSMHTARTWHTTRQASPDYLGAVASAFDVEPRWLLMGEGDIYRPKKLGRATRLPTDPDFVPLFVEIARVLAGRGHEWAFMNEGPGPIQFCHFSTSYLESRGEEPTPERVVEVMDQHFFMLREGFFTPMEDKWRVLSALYSALATAWLQIKED